MYQWCSLYGSWIDYLTPILMEEIMRENMFVIVGIAMIILEIILRIRLYCLNERPANSYVCRLFTFIISLLLLAVPAIISLALLDSGISMIETISRDGGYIIFAIKCTIASILTTVGGLLFVFIVFVLLYAFYINFIHIDTKQNITMEEKR